MSNRQDLQWYVVRTKPTANRNRTTQEVDCQMEPYVDRLGRRRARRIKGTGRRVFVIESIFKQRGFETFLPARKVWRQRNRYKKQKHLTAYPLFVGWIFVGWPADEVRWKNLFGTPCVDWVVSVDGEPYQIPQSAMEDMFDRLGDDKTTAPDRERFMRTHQEFNIGDTVRVIEGPFQGQEVRVVDLSGAKAKALIEILGGKREIDVDTRNLAVA